MSPFKISYWLSNAIDVRRATSPKPKGKPKQPSTKPAEPTRQQPG